MEQTKDSGDKVQGSTERFTLHASRCTHYACVANDIREIMELRTV